MVLIPNSGRPGPIYNDAAAQTSAAPSNTTYLLASNNLSDLTNVLQARLNLGLGTAATSSSAAFDPAGAAIAAQNAAEAYARSLLSGIPSGTGSVTSVSVTTANGVSGVVATPTTTPAITLTLGAITPTTVNGITLTTGTGTLTLGTATLNAGTGGTLGPGAFASSSTGSGAVVLQTSPTLITPVFSGATLSGTTVLSSLTTNGFVKTTGGTGTLAVDTNTYLTAAGAVTSLTGTANQVSVSASTGAVTVSLPSTLTLPGTLQSGNIGVNYAPQPYYSIIIGGSLTGSTVGLYMYETHNAVAGGASSFVGVQSSPTWNIGTYGADTGWSYRIGQVTVSGASTLTNHYGLYIDPQVNLTGGASVTNVYGIYQQGTDNNTFKGGFLMGSASGGNKGPGTINATALYINGTAVGTSAGMSNPMTTLGDIIIGAGGGSPARLGAGTAGYVLTMVSGSPAWAAGGGGGFTNPMTNTGDLIYSSSGSTPARLGIGGAGNVLTVSGGVPVWQPLSGTTYTGYKYPESYGAVGNGIADDSYAIMQAYNACAAGQALFLSGNYGVGIGTSSASHLYGGYPSGVGLYFTRTNVGIMSAPGAHITACSSSPPASVPATIGVSFESGNWNGTQIVLPNIDSFSNIQLQLRSTAFLNLNVGELQAGAVGLDLTAYNSGGVLNLAACNIMVQSFGNLTTTAIQLQRLVALLGVQVQGNNIWTNFVSGCNRWVYYANPASLSGVSSDIENFFMCNAYDPGDPGKGAHLVGACYMIDNQGGGESAQNTFWVTCGVYNLVAGDKFVQGTYTQGFDQCDFKFGPGSSQSIASSPSTAQQYAIYQNIESGGVTGSRVDFGAGIQNPAGAIACTATNSRGSFNGGNAVFCNRFAVSMALSSVANFGTATFYAYSPWVQGNCKLTFVPQSMSGCFVESITDNSGSFANEIKIVVRNASGSTSSATLTGVIIAGV